MGGWGSEGVEGGFVSDSGKSGEYDEGVDGSASRERNKDRSKSGSFSLRSSSSHLPFHAFLTGGRAVEEGFDQRVAIGGGCVCGREGGGGRARSVCS